ncbi:hypothetical protein B0H15DRAFT_1003496 [Mycena belliarum]|uniref:F-box domain-containing protein n=1 Tax=Mycena belliarum TaxID=1033014 RepID=A0AAD6TTI5_9AGAR|nr:hypothetical protein B0H15DRAFT_1003496 [Mycena belliae]
MQSPQYLSSPDTCAIHTLPSELLAEIFALCWHAFTPSFPDTHDSVSIEVEIRRLAHAPLLELSQVCSRWHAIAVGTPSLWSDICLDSVLWRPALRNPTRVTTLLKAALERGGNASIILTIRNDFDSLPPALVVALLVAHSERWKKLAIGCDGPVLALFSGIAGRLSRLDYLEIYVSEEGPEDMTVFEVAPRLTDVTYSGDSASALGRFPLEQLWCLTCMALTPLELPIIISLARRLPSAGELRLQFSLVDQPSDEALQYDIPPVTSDIGILFVEVVDPFYPFHSEQTLGGLFESLTLPSLDKIELESSEYPRLLLTWPQESFLALSARSSFDAHLRVLEIYDVHITHGELLACLSGLSSLERLAISDHQTVATGGGIASHLITDALLARLTLAPGSSELVPRLRSASFQSLLRFADSAYLAFVLSRVDNGAAPPFKSHLCWLPGCHRVLDATTTAQLDDLGAQMLLTFRFSEAESEWI